MLRYFSSPRGSAEPSLWLLMSYREIAPKDGIYDTGENMVRFNMYYQAVLQQCDTNTCSQQQQMNYRNCTSLERRGIVNLTIPVQHLMFISYFFFIMLYIANIFSVNKFLLSIHTPAFHTAPTLPECSLSLGWGRGG